MEMEGRRIPVLDEHASSLEDSQGLGPAPCLPLEETAGPATPDPVFATLSSPA